MVWGVRSDAANPGRAVQRYPERSRARYLSGEDVKRLGDALFAAQRSKLEPWQAIAAKGDLYVRIGGDDAKWQPSNSGFSNYREYAAGTGWKVWVSLPGNPDVQQTPVRAAFAVPAYQASETISVPDNLLE